jgi:hypothetical protein
MRSSDTALVDKIALQAPDLLVDEIVGLVNETNRDIRHYFSGTCLTEFSEIVIDRVRLRCQPTDKLCLATDCPSPTVDAFAPGGNRDNHRAILRG